MTYSYDQAYQYAKQNGSKIAYAPNDPAEVQYLTDWYAKEQAKLQRPDVFMGDEWTPPSITGNFFTDPNVLGSTWEGNQQRIHYRDGTTKLNPPYEESYGVGGFLGDVTKLGAQIGLGVMTAGQGAIPGAIGGGVLGFAGSGGDPRAAALGTVLGGGIGYLAGGVGLPTDPTSVASARALSGIGDTGLMPDGSPAPSYSLGGPYGSQGTFGFIPDYNIPGDIGFGGVTPWLNQAGGAFTVPYDMVADAIRMGVPYEEAIKGSPLETYRPGPYAQDAGYTPFTPDPSLDPNAPSSTDLTSLKKLATKMALGSVLGGLGGAGQGGGSAGGGGGGGYTVGDPGQGTYSTPKGLSALLSGPSRAPIASPTGSGYAENLSNLQRALAALKSMQSPQQVALNQAFRV